MYCENCGSKLEDGDLFCQNCGAKVPANDQPELADDSAQQTQLLSGAEELSGQTEAIPKDVEAQTEVLHSDEISQENLDSMVGDSNMQEDNGQYSNQQNANDGWNQTTNNQNANGGWNQTTGKQNYSGNNQFGGNQNQVPNVEPKKKSHKGLIIGISIVAVLLIAIISVGAIYVTTDGTFKSNKSRLNAVSAKLEKYEKEKEQYLISDDTDDYDEYETLIDECKDVIKREKVKQAESTIGDVESQLDKLIRSNDKYVDEKVAEYKEVNLSSAKKDEKSNFDSCVEEINNLKKEHKYSSIPDQFLKLDDIVVQYIESDEVVSVYISRVDTSNYPKVKLTVQVTNQSSFSPISNLETDKFHVEKVTGFEKYQSQNVNSVTYDSSYQTYEVEFTDKSKDEIKDSNSIEVRYKSKEYDGEGSCAYLPSGNKDYVGDGPECVGGPESTLEDYISRYPDAITEQNYTYISDYIKSGSSMEKEQSSYIQNKEVDEKMISYNIKNVKYSSSKKCVVTTEERYQINYYDDNFTSKDMTQTCKYNVEKVDGQWLITGYAGDIKAVTNSKGTW